ncbi:hypothetical protein J1N35_025944 [Gossypium stocksii]|uniref:RNase H type-1 domain-containing protein n=1 Tax=Gossypium stocksii TaxID=47602 RepID=A0A9D3V7A4_9ROSI|nr:hypothetical protein J1N35_025944 [Gossypium stocksii]
MQIPLASQNEENNNHVLRQCPTTVEVWSYISELKGIEETLILETGRGPKYDEMRTSVAIYFDEAFDQQSFKSASGLIVRDVRGEILASKSVLHSDVESLFAAEAHARLQAIRLGIFIGFKVLAIQEL